MGRPRAVIAILALAAVACIPASAPAATGPIFAVPTLFNLGPRKPPPSLVFSYHGFQVDASKAPRNIPPDRTIRQIKAQIDLVEHVGLKPDALAFLRSVPIQADPTKPGEAGRYVPGRGVLLKVARLAPKKPVLLAGLLQAYHDQRLTGGDIARFRSEAASRHVWPKTALMLQSDSDYFALTGSTYLCGAITREPYTRANLRQTQPAYYRWLANLFDGGRARG